MAKPNCSFSHIFLLNLTITLIFSTSFISRSAAINGKTIQYIDITHKITPNLPAYGSDKGTGNYIWLVSSIKNGSLSNNSEFKLSTHTGTHIDAPSHFFQYYYDQGVDITTVNLTTLHGPVLLVDVPRNKNITDEVMKSLRIPKNVTRVLFRTVNTDRKLMYKKAFDSSYAGFTKTGAEWLVKNTNIRLAGVDYLSVAISTEPAPVHALFLRNQRVIPVEGLKLDNVKAGYYELQCLPLNLERADGCPARCILMS